MIKINDNTRPYLAAGVIAALILLLAMSVLSAYGTIQSKDQAALLANNSFKDNPGDPLLKARYNTAAKEYIGATAYFPGNLIGGVTGYPHDKWSLIDVPNRNSLPWENPVVWSVTEGIK